MTFWVKRILLKSGEIVTEKELSKNENIFDGHAPEAGDNIRVTCRGREFDAKVLVGRFADRPDPEENIIYPIRVEEI